MYVCLQWKIKNAYSIDNLQEIKKKRCCDKKKYIYYIYICPKNYSASYILKQLIWQVLWRILYSETADLASIMAHPIF